MYSASHAMNVARGNSLLRSEGNHEAEEMKLVKSGITDLWQ